MEFLSCFFNLALYPYLFVTPIINYFLFSRLSFFYAQKVIYHCISEKQKTNEQKNPQTPELLTDLFS